MLVWEFYREISSSASGTGGAVHYYNESTQSVYLNAGLRTRVAEAREGHWRESVLSAEMQIATDSYDALSLDHPANGTLYAIASDGDDMYFLRYLYALDLSEVYASGSWQEQIDNQVRQFSLDVRNVGAETFAAGNTLFNPGGKLTLAFTAGDSDPYDIGIAYLDEVSYDVYGDTVPISGRNTIGYYLASQSFGQDILFSGNRKSVFSAILAAASVPRYIVKTDNTQITLGFEPETAFLEGINNAIGAVGWIMAETSDGTVIIGDDEFVSAYSINSRYVFNGGSEVFRRQTGKNADAAYAYVCVKDSAGGTAYAPVSHWPYWNIGPHKIKFVEAPKGMGGSQLSAYATELAEKLRYVGIGEVFVSPLRPQLLIGDVAEVYYTGDVESTSLGLITQIKHTFGGSGFFTEFSIDSGGSATDGDNYTVVSRAVVLDGYNRKQRVLDFVGLVSARQAAAYAGGTRAAVSSAPAEAPSISPAGTLRIM